MIPQYNPYTLTVSQISRADEWRIKHAKHIDKLIEGVYKEVFPSDPEDQNNPRLWKAEHWRWFHSNFYPY